MRCHDSVMHAEILIGGVFYGGPCDQSIGKTRHDNPITGRMVGSAAEAGWAEVSAALDATKEAFATWRCSSREDRSDLLLRTTRALRERRTEFAELLRDELAKPITLAYAEVDRAAITFEIAAREALTFGLPEQVDVSLDPRSAGVSVTVNRRPLGPILGIVPANWPLNLAAHKIAPALASGNTILIKAPSIGTLSTLRLCRLIHEAGCPDGVVNAIGCVPALAQKAAQDPRVAKLSFTGSPKVGWMLRDLLPRLPMTLELGGDATAVVAEDADLDHAVSKLIPSAFGFAGQVCISAQHVLVHRSVYDSFVSPFVAATEALALSDPTDPACLCGPLMTPEAAEKVMEWIDEAESAGARVLCGGNRVGGYVEPTVIEGVTRAVRLGCDEVFGPVVTIQPYDEPEEIIHWINASRFGIHAAVFSSTQQLIDRLDRELAVGGLIVNDSPSLRFDAMPYGGVKESGMGREGIRSAMLSMTEEHTVVVRS